MIEELKDHFLRPSSNNFEDVEEHKEGKKNQNENIKLSNIILLNPEDIAKLNRNQNKDPGEKSREIENESNIPNFHKSSVIKQPFDELRLPENEGKDKLQYIIKKVKNQDETYMKKVYLINGIIIGLLIILFLIYHLIMAPISEKLVGILDLFLSILLDLIILSFYFSNVHRSRPKKIVIMILTFSVNTIFAFFGHQWPFAVLINCHLLGIFITYYFINSIIFLNLEVRNIREQNLISEPEGVLKKLINKILFIIFRFEFQLITLYSLMELVILQISFQINFFGLIYNQFDDYYVASFIMKIFTEKDGIILLEIFLIYFSFLINLSIFVNKVAIFFNRILAILIIIWIINILIAIIIRTQLMFFSEVELAFSFLIHPLFFCIQNFLKIWVQNDYSLYSDDNSDEVEVNESQISQLFKILRYFIPKNKNDIFSLILNLFIGGIIAGLLFGDHYSNYIEEYFSYQIGIFSMGTLYLFVGIFQYILSYYKIRISTIIFLLIGMILYTFLLIFILFFENNESWDNKIAEVKGFLIYYFILFSFLEFYIFFDRKLKLKLDIIIIHFLCFCLLLIVVIYSFLNDSNYNALMTLIIDIFSSLGAFYVYSKSANKVNLICLSKLVLAIFLSGNYIYGFLSLYLYDEGYPLNLSNSIIIIFIGIIFTILVEWYIGKKSINNEKEYFSIPSIHLFPYFKYNAITERFESWNIGIIYKLGIFAVLIVLSCATIFLFPNNQRTLILLFINCAFFYIIHITLSNYYKRRSIGYKKAMEYLTPKLILSCLIESLYENSKAKIKNKFNNYTKLEIFFRDFYKEYNSNFNLQKWENVIKMQYYEMKGIQPEQKEINLCLETTFKEDEFELKSMWSKLKVSQQNIYNLTFWDQLQNYCNLIKKHEELYYNFLRFIAGFNFLMIKRVKSIKYSNKLKDSEIRQKDEESISYSKSSSHSNSVLHSDRTEIIALQRMDTNMRNKIQNLLSNHNLGLNEFDLYKEIGSHINLSAEEIFHQDKKVFILNSSVENKLDQGELGDCWLIVGMLTLALEYPEIIKNCFLDSRNEYERNKTIPFSFFPNGKNCIINISDGYPCDPETHLPLFCRPINDGYAKIIWPMVIEKAFAQYYKGYKQLEGGTIDVCLAELTNCPVFRHQISNSNEFSNDFFVLWDKLVNYYNKKYLIGAGSLEKENQITNQLLQKHAYAITRLIEIDSYKIIEMTTSNINPFIGKNGDWINKLSKIRRVREAVKITDSREKNLIKNLPQNNCSNLKEEKSEDEYLIKTTEDSIFRLSYQEFLENFGVLFACKILDKNEWICPNIPEDCWKEGRNGGSSAYPDTFLHNPQYGIQISRKVNIIFQMHLLIDAIQTKHLIGFELFHLHYNCPLQLVTDNSDSKLKSIATNIGGFIDSKIVSLDINLNKGNFILIPSSYFRYIEERFLLKIWYPKKDEEYIKIIPLNPNEF